MWKGDRKENVEIEESTIEVAGMGGGDIVSVQI